MSGVRDTLRKYGVKKPIEEIRVKRENKKIKQKPLSREEQHKINLRRIEEEGKRFREAEEERKRIEEENERIEQLNYVQNKLTNPFSLGREIDSAEVRQATIDNVLPKSLIPETLTSYPEPFEEEPALNRELAEFKKQINGHLSKLGFASSSGGGAGFISDLDDIQGSTAKVDGKFLKYSSSDAKWIGDDPSVTTLAITALDIDGGTDIGADLADADLIIVDDGAGGTNRKATLSRLKTYIGAGAADDLSAGDAAVTLTTSSGNITIDAAANNSDIILKGTDGGADTTFLTIDGSEAGKATFNDEIVSGAVITSGAGLVIANAGNIGSASDTDAISISSGGVVNISATTASTNSTTGALTVGGGAGVAADLSVGDDLRLISDSAVLSFGADSDTTLTHTDGSGLTLNSTNKLMFNDASQFIQGASATVLDIAATDEIELTATLIDVVGNLAGSGTGTFAGILKTDDTTEATSTTDGSLQTDGGLSVAKDIVAGDDIKLLSDSSVVAFGADSEIVLTHVHNQGLSMTTTHDAPLVRRGEDVFIVLDGTNSASANAGDNVVMDASAAGTDVGDDIIGEDQVFLHTGMQRDVINIIGSDGKVKKSIAGFSAGAI